MINKFTDKDLGEIRVKRNARAKRSIARRKTDHFELTIPIAYSDEQLLHVFDKLRSRMFNLPECKGYFFSEDSEFNTLTFKVKIVRRDVYRVCANFDQNFLLIAVPIQADISNNEVQLQIRTCIERAMRLEATRTLPKKVDLLAKKYMFTYRCVKITKSKSRWGSCSSTKNINLSYNCMLLPESLIDFVILHELCHTKEMNHGIGFWSLLNSVCEDKAKELTRKLNQFSTYW